jgi:hypothetical protein
MPKGPRITDEVKRFIAEINDEHPEWVAKEVKNEVQSRLKYLGHQAKPDWPGISTVQIELKKIREERENGPLPIDGPWSIGSLAKYDIPSEAVSKVLEIQAIRATHEPLTIREAKWIGRLYSVTDEIMELAVWAAMYANEEKICDLANIEKDTSDLDSAVHSRLVTATPYFNWLFRQTWIPDSYKRQVAEEQALKYERLWGLEMDRPDFSLKGWFMYATSLQFMVLYSKRSEEIPKKQRELLVIRQREIARTEGWILQAELEKHRDLIRSTIEGVHKDKFLNDE